MFRPAYDLFSQCNTEAEVQRAIADRLRTAQHDLQVEATAVITTHGDPIVYRFRGRRLPIRRTQGGVAWLGRISEIVFDRMHPPRSIDLEYDTS